MKTIKLLLIGLVLLFTGVAQAQFSMSINLPAPPMWGPAGHSTVRYYYMPDVEAYYDLNTSMFIYFGGNAWVRRAHLPARYKNYDLYGGYKVVMPDYRGNAPYSHFKEHKMKYGKGYRGKPQRTVGDRTGRRYPGGNEIHQRPQENPRHNGNGRNSGNNHNKGNGHGNDKGGGKGNKK
jgi:hypothetical protein